MNDRKKSFIIYTDYKDAFKALSNDDAAALIYALFDFVEFGTIADLPPAAKMAFLFISEQIKRDTEKYEKICKKRKEAGKKGGRPKKTDIDENQTETKKANGFSENQDNQTESKKADNEDVDDNDNEDVDDINKRYIVGKEPTPPYKAVIDYLNEKTHSHYKHTTKATQRIINGRLSDGFTVEDFKRVIDTKSAQWLNDKKMSAYLRPETLFAASHFESYLNEERPTAKESKYPGISEKMARETETNTEKTDNYDYGDFA